MNHKKEVAMTRTYRALTTLALSLALVAATAAVAAAVPSAEDQNDRLFRGIETAQAARTQAAVEQARALERQAGADAAQVTQRKALYESELQQNLAVAAQPAAEDQNDRLLRNLEAAQAQRTQAAVERVRAGERELGPAPVVTIAAQPVPAATGRDVDLIAVALLALVGGLIGGAAWTAASRRRPNRAVAA
jgi:hypothetical protein